MGDEPTLYECDVDATTDGWVTTLQLALDRAGHRPELGIDGKFGWRTKQSVVAFQTDKGFADRNGVVGNQTWAALMERDPEPPGVNNGPRGGLANCPPGSGTGPATSGRRGGIGASYAHVDIEFTTDPTSDGSYIYVDIDVQGTLNEDVRVWAVLYQNGVEIRTSETIAVNSNGPQTIPIGVSVVSGNYQVRVHAYGQGGNATAQRDGAFSL